MTIKEDKVTLWDSNGDKLLLYAVPCESQYKYIEGEPCITFEFVADQTLLEPLIQSLLVSQVE